MQSYNAGVNIVLHILPYASFATNNVLLLLMPTVTHKKAFNFDIRF